MEVNVHDFPHLGRGKAVPYGAYDIARNRAVVNVGVSYEQRSSRSRVFGAGGEWTAGASTEPRGDS